jgi:hypothetical protein
MGFLDSDRMMHVFTMVAILLFVAAAIPLARWRGRMRQAALAVYFVALGLALVRVALWLFGGGSPHL